jgi:dTDP-4-amino-4,6-dideoxygalactose transaminase
VVPFARPDLTTAESDAVLRVLSSGWLTSGIECWSFEAEFQAASGGEMTAISVSSATAGLHLAVEALGVDAGDRVIIPTLTFTATAEVVRYVGADPLFIDIDLSTYCLSEEAACEALRTSERVTAVMPVHIGGYPMQYGRLGRMCRAAGVGVVEDCAHASPFQQAVGLLGGHDADAAVYSFYANKCLTTGEGGMLLTRSPEVAAKARVLRLHGIDHDAFARFGEPGDWEYDVVAPGYKYNLPDLAAAIGRAQLGRLSEMHKRRVELADRYMRELRDLPVVLPPTPLLPDGHAWHLFILRVDETATDLSREQVVAALHQAGVATSLHYTPLHRLSYWRDRYSLVPEDFPAAETYFRTAFSIPLFSAMSDDEQGLVVETLCGLGW